MRERDGESWMVVCVDDGRVYAECDREKALMLATHLNSDSEGVYTYKAEKVPENG